MVSFGHFGFHTFNNGNGENDVQYEEGRLGYGIGVYKNVAGRVFADLWCGYEMIRVG